MIIIVKMKLEIETTDTTLDEINRWATLYLCGARLFLFFLRNWGAATAIGPMINWRMNDEDLCEHVTGQDNGAMSHHIFYPLRTWSTGLSAFLYMSKDTHITRIRNLGNFV
jgi:hypothetical protein